MATSFRKITTVQAYEADHEFIKEMAREHDMKMPAVLAALIRGFRNASPTVQEQAFIPPTFKPENEVAA